MALPGSDLMELAIFIFVVFGIGLSSVSLLYRYFVWYVSYNETRNIYTSLYSIQFAVAGLLQEYPSQVS